eukprot:Phypoly_transcript_00780.p1 GENE.Phypoly_transcript_00780~~Phypoly_transcript_00780.p1  ORF type:complete len:860 (+),score=157.24 Phypoly_transcript_00780:1425-4004(+)
MVKDYTLKTNIGPDATEVPRKVAAFTRWWIEDLFQQDFHHNADAQEGLFSIILELEKRDALYANILKLSFVRANKKKVAMMCKRNLETPASQLPPRKSRSFSANTKTMQRAEYELDSIIDWHSSEVAEQFTLIELCLFKAIKLVEVSNKAWKLDTKRKISPHVVNILRRFDLVSQWVATEVVMASTPKQRIAITEKLISLAQKCLDLQNYNSLFEIMDGLRKPSVRRLKSTWEAISLSCQTTYKALREVVDERNNYKTYREHLQKSTLPCLPCVDVFLRDLLLVAELPEIDGENINFEKIYRNSRIFKDIQMFQQSRYISEYDQLLQPSLVRLQAIPEVFLYENSQKIEPEPTKEADLQQLHEILERRRMQLAKRRIEGVLEGTDEWQEIRYVDELLLKGVSSLTQLPAKDSEMLKKELAKQLLAKAFNLLDQEKLPEARSYLEISAELYKSDENEKMMLELQLQIKEREKLSEHELQMRVETRRNTIKADIIHAEKQAQEVSTQAEREMIDQQLVVLRLQEEKLQDQITAYEARNQKLQEREAQVEQREQLLSEQTTQLEQLLAELVTAPSTDVSALHTQMEVVVKGDKDVDSARRRFSSMQKKAKAAQKALVEEERRQRERVVWLQKQMEIFHTKGMSPAQRAFRNFLKDVKRLASVRQLEQAARPLGTSMPPSDTHQIEYTPHPLRCFISYAWEPDQDANKELQKRLQRLKDDLEIAGMEVTLDIRDMKFDMQEFMVHNINRAHHLLLICTPRLQIRAADPAKNNLQLELETALQKEKTFIVPLIFAGTFSNAVPQQFSRLLAIDLTSPQLHYSAMASLAPMGLIPMLLGLERNKDYKRIHDHLFLGLEHYDQPQL